MAKDWSLFEFLAWRFKRIPAIGSAETLSPSVLADIKAEAIESNILVYVREDDINLAWKSYRAESLRRMECNRQRMELRLKQRQ